MCYPKPGPRCSAHAATQLAKAKAAFELRGSSVEFDEYLALQHEVDKAQIEFDITPAGLRFLEDEVLQGSHKASEQARYELALAERQSRLEALWKAGKAVREARHATKKFSSHSEEFLDSSITRMDSDETALREKMINESASWLNKLSHEEMTQIRWMTDYGAMEANTHIGGSNNYKLLNGAFPPEEIEKRMKSVDSALDKFSGPQEIVYRGLREGFLPKNLAHNYRVAPEEKKKAALERFVEGEEFTSDFYMPTSSQPDAAKGFADYGIVLEIKTHKAAPVSSVSILQSENERLIKRDARFKVVKVLESVPFGKNSMPYSVIQLEQIN